MDWFKVSHMKAEDWDKFQIPEKECANAWDDHTPKDVAERLAKYVRCEK